MKTCSNKECKQINPQTLECFAPRASSKDGRRSTCRDCRNGRERSKPKTDKDRENSRTRSAKYRSLHPDKVAAQLEEARQDPNFYKKAAEATARYRASHPEKVREQNERAKTDPQIKRKRKASLDKYRSKDLEGRRKKENERNALPEIKIRRKASAKKSRQNNKAKDCAKSNRRYAGKIQRMPKWLTKEQIKDMEDIYVLCDDLQWLTASTDPLQVDHIFPMNGENISGLHVPWNLQIIPREENVKKSNKLFDQDVEDHKNFVMSLINNKK